MMAVTVIVVSPALARLRCQGALLLIRRLEYKTQDARNDHKDCCKNGYLHSARSSGWKSIPR